MDEYKIKLETFEGPMALLMHLIEKDELDINDIPIAKVTEQYLAYLKALEEFNVDIASEFVLMAATLLQIKSRLLLPRPDLADDNLDEFSDPREDLIQRLLEYRKFKQLAGILEMMGIKRQRYYSRLPYEFVEQVLLPSGLTMNDLLSALASLLSSEAVNYALVDHEEISVQDKINDIMGWLLQHNGKLEFMQTLRRSGSRPEMIAGFLAILELIKLRRIAIEQKERFGPIYLMLRGESA